MFDPLMETKQMVKSSDRRTQTVSGCCVSYYHDCLYFQLEMVDEYFKNSEKHVSRAIADR